MVRGGRAHAAVVRGDRAHEVVVRGGRAHEVVVRGGRAHAVPTGIAMAASRRPEMCGAGGGHPGRGGVSGADESRMRCELDP